MALLTHAVCYQIEQLIYPCTSPAWLLSRCQGWL